MKIKSIFATFVASVVLAMVGTSSIFTSNASAAEKKDFEVAWSHYTGWEPWQFAADSGILKKHADKHGITIKLSAPMDYVESMTQFTAGKFDGCVMTNMDALTIPAVGGVDSTIIIVGDYSNGNDGIVLKKGKSVTDLKGRNTMLVMNTVSDYMLSRALGMNGLKDSDVKRTNVSDSEIAALFSADDNAAVVTWNPPLMTVRNDPKGTLVFDSSKIPGEILDCMVVKTDAPESLKKALAGAWYEVCQIMTGEGKATDDAIASMAKTAGGTVAEFKAQLKTTFMYYAAKDAAAFAESPKLKETMEMVRTFCFDHALFPDSASSKDAVGISFPDGSVLGSTRNLKLRFDATFMKLAAEGKL